MYASSDSTNNIESEIHKVMKTGGVTTDCYLKVCWEIALDITMYLTKTCYEDSSSNTQYQLLRAACVSTNEHK